MVLFYGASPDCSAEQKQGGMTRLGMCNARGDGLGHGNWRCRIKQQHGKTSNRQGMQAWISMLATFRTQQLMTT
jgi:hypothetical protein